MWQYLIVDLDNTLYSAQTGVFDLVDARIQRFLTERLGMDDARARAFRLVCMGRFGTTLRGLQFYYPDINPYEFLNYAHAIPLEGFLHPDPELRALLKAISIPKVIFTNSDERHTARVLSLLGLESIFDAWITIERLQFVPKPNWEAFATLVRELKAVPPRCILVDDLRRNLAMGRRWGFHCVWVRQAAPTSGPVNGFHVISTIYDLPRVFPHL